MYKTVVWKTEQHDDDLPNYQVSAMFRKNLNTAWHI